MISNFQKCAPFFPDDIEVYDAPTPDRFGWHPSMGVGYSVVVVSACLSNITVGQCRGGMFCASAHIAQNIAYYSMPAWQSPAIVSAEPMIGPVLLIFLRGDLRSSACEWLSRHAEVRTNSRPFRASDKTGRSTKKTIARPGIRRWLRSFSLWTSQVVEGLSHSDQMETNMRIPGLGHADHHVGNAPEGPGKYRLPSQKHTSYIGHCCCTDPHPSNVGCDMSHADNIFHKSRTGHLCRTDHHGGSVCDSPDRSKLSSRNRWYIYR